jgi:hypothetical protein
MKKEYRLKVFENRMLKRIFRPKREEVTKGWIHFRYKEFHNSYSSPDIISVIKSRKMRRLNM